MIGPSTCTSRDGLTAGDRTTVAPARATTRRLLVATDGSRTAGAALRLTAEMLRIEPGHLTVLTILEPRTTFLTDSLLDGGRLLRDDVRTHNVLDKVARQLTSIGLRHSALRVAFGHAGPTIGAIAHEVEASMIVMGLGRHRWLSRLFGSETVTGILPYADVPVLAVHREARTLPTSALCAIDFGDSSVTAALTVLRLLEPGGELHLVHVAPRANATAHEEGWHRVYEAGVEGGFRRLRALLNRGDITIMTHLLHGDITTELLGFAQRNNTGLIALGRHNQSGIARAMIGSTPNALLRAAHCSILVAPDALGYAPSGSLPHDAAVSCEAGLQETYV